MVHVGLGQTSTFKNQGKASRNGPINIIRIDIDAYGRAFSQGIRKRGHSLSGHPITILNKLSSALLYSNGKSDLAAANSKA
jgi:CRISPR/Cas system-associated protein Cas10 (large subunit of type III CRISPR-Cas system)